MNEQHTQRRQQAEMFAHCTEAAEDITVRYRPQPTRIDASYPTSVSLIADVIDMTFVHSDLIQIIEREEQYCEICMQRRTGCERMPLQGSEYIMCADCRADHADSIRDERGRLWMAGQKEDEAQDQ